VYSTITRCKGQKSTCTHSPPRVPRAFAENELALSWEATNGFCFRLASWSPGCLLGPRGQLWFRRTYLPSKYLTHEDSIFWERAQRHIVPLNQSPFQSRPRPLLLSISAVLPPYLGYPLLSFWADITSAVTVPDTFNHGTKILYSVLLAASHQQTRHSFAG